MKKTVVVFSGGLDSTTLLYHLRAEGYELRALSVDYGQRHGGRELAAAGTICGKLGVERRLMDLRALVEFLGPNSLSDPGLAVPEGRYEADTMRITTVPNRNMVLISVAVAWAVSLKYGSVAYGAHGGPSTNYPDCRPEFAVALDNVTRLCDWEPVRVLAPFVSWDKGDIVKLGAELGVPFELTWSCYKGGERHCGTCGTRNDRKEAFRKHGLRDPVEYEA
jgi:7-cyano-7-deazaguanine synthase